MHEIIIIMIVVMMMAVMMMKMMMVMMMKMMMVMMMMMVVVVVMTIMLMWVMMVVYCSSPLSQSLIICDLHFSESFLHLPSLHSMSSDKLKHTDRLKHTRLNPVSLNFHLNWFQDWRIAPCAWVLVYREGRIRTGWVRENYKVLLLLLSSVAT